MQESLYFNNKMEQYVFSVNVTKTALMSTFHIHCIFLFTFVIYLTFACTSTASQTLFTSKWLDYNLYSPQV